MRKILRKLLPITFTLAVATAVTFSTPVFVERAYAAPMEDCDLDGYDDHTGKPVPWRGFDGTKGDEVPSDWDGVSDSYVFKNNKSDSSKSNSSSSLSSSSSSRVHQEAALQVVLVLQVQRRLQQRVAQKVKAQRVVQRQAQKVVQKVLQKAQKKSLQKIAQKKKQLQK